MVLAFRKSGAKSVGVSLHDETIDAMTVEWSETGPCDKEHCSSGEISDEEWDRRHAWNESLGEFNLQDGKDMFEEIGILRRENEELKLAACDCSPKDTPGVQTVEEGLFNLPEQESPKSEDQFDMWYDSTPVPPHFKR